jgi:hypothetical protein
MKRFALVFALCLVATPALARHHVANTACTNDQCKLLDAVASNAAAALRTFTIDVTGWVQVSLQVDYVWAAGTDVTVTCSTSNNQGTSYAPITSTAVAAGVGTVTPYVDHFAVTASANFSLAFDIRSQDKFRCVVAVTGGAAGDTITVYASATRYRTNEMPAAAEQ